MIAQQRSSDNAAAPTTADKDPHPTVGKQTHAGAVANDHPGGSDALGQKENKVAPYFAEMANVVRQLAPKFKPLGMTFRSEIVLATVLQEASNSDPLTGTSPDGGLGLMQITPYNGKLDAPVAKVLGWDNAQSVEYNVEHSKWRQAQANLLAGGETLLGKAEAIKLGVPKTWSEMNDSQKWRATMYAYNAGQGAAISALESGGPNARMLSTYTIGGVTHSHDYTAELDQKLDYVDKHDPFSKGSAAPSPAPAPTGGAPIAAAPAKKKPASATPEGYKPAPTLAQVAANQAVIEIGMAGASVKFVQQHVKTVVDGEFGPITQGKVREYQGSKGLEQDGVVGDQTLAAMQGKQPKAPPKTPPKKASGNGGTVAGGGKSPPAGGSPVAIASRFVGLNSWNAKLRDDIRGNGWSYNNEGRVTNNCAEFVSSCLRMAGEISFQNDNVDSMEGQLKSAGWKYRAGQKESKPNDVWIHTGDPDHTVLVATAGATETVGSDGSSEEFIKREPMPYSGARYMYKG